MKNIILSIAIASLCLQIISCRKSEPKPEECQVQQFGAPWRTYVDGQTTTIPYLFSKTFDHNGRVSTIDAYLFSLAPGHHVKIKLSYQGQMTYLLNSEMANDTLMVLWLNNRGRIVKAEERGALDQDLSPRYRYEYSYNSQDKVENIHLTAVNDRYLVFDEICRYDDSGNIVRLSNTAYEYDYSKTVKKQFYMDIENMSTGHRGTRLLSYLGYFPEFTSPKNLRIISRTINTAGGAYLFNYALGDHKFDSDGKLVFYEYTLGFPPLQPAPIIWTCDKALP